MVKLHIVIFNNVNIVHKYVIITIFLLIPIMQVLSIFIF